jgi:hypothetical protein
MIFDRCFIELCFAICPEPIDFAIFAEANPSLAKSELVIIAGDRKRSCSRNEILENVKTIFHFVSRPITIAFRAKRRMIRSAVRPFSQEPESAIWNA